MNRKESTIVEITTVLLEILLVNILINFFFYELQPNQADYLSLNPHPLFLFSLIMGLRYGIKGGVFSACISGLFYFDVYMQTHGNVELFFTYFKYYKNPLLFLWGGFILGAFRDNHRRKVRKANETIDFLTQENANLEKDYMYLDSIQKELKNQIIKSDESISSLYDIAKKLESFEIEEIYTETIGVLMKYLKATNISLYTVDREHDYLRLKISYSDVERSNSIKASTCSWFLHVDKERKVVKNPNYRASDDVPLMVAPLIRDNRVIAAVIITSMEFDMISEYAFNLFQLIIDWINRTLEKAKYVESLKGSKYIGTSKLIKDSNYFMNQIKIERRRKKEFGMEYCLLSYRVKDCELITIDTLVKDTLRAVDLAYYNENKQVITFLLPATKREHAILIEDRIEKNFSDNFVKIDLAPLDDRMA